MRIVIVDDAEMNLNFIKMFLLKLNCKCEPFYFRNPLEALNAIPEIEPDVCFIDYLMFDMDGISLIENLRAANVKCPFILFTATDLQEIRNECKNKDIKFLDKVLVLQELEGMLNHVCN